MASASWWVIPEGFPGKLVNALGPGITLNLYTVTQSAAQPAGAAAGPFATQAEAQAKATQFNQAGQNVPTLPNIAKSAIGVGQNTGGGNPGGGGWALQWGNTSGLLIRSLKVIFGGVLIIAGIMRFSGARQDILQIAKGAVLK